MLFMLNYFLYLIYGVIPVNYTIFDKYSFFNKYNLTFFNILSLMLGFKL